MVVLVAIVGDRAHIVTEGEPRFRMEASADLLRRRMGKATSARFSAQVRFGSLEIEERLPLEVRP